MPIEPYRVPKSPRSDGGAELADAIKRVRAFEDWASNHYETPSADPYKGLPAGTDMEDRWELIGAYLDSLDVPVSQSLEACVAEVADIIRSACYAEITDKAVAEYCARAIRERWPTAVEPPQEQWWMCECNYMNSGVICTHCGKSQRQEVIDASKDALLNNDELPNPVVVEPSEALALAKVAENLAACCLPSSSSLMNIAAMLRSQDAEIKRLTAHLGIAEDTGTTLSMEKAYLEEQHERLRTSHAKMVWRHDDSEEITGAWLESLGWKVREPTALTGCTHVCPNTNEDIRWGISQGFYISMFQCKNVKNRGDVRRALTAILAESAPQKETPNATVANDD